MELKQKMASSLNDKLLQPSEEKPNHYTYLKEFRVEQCPNFLQHKCSQHRPFVCFNWHFMNQRRRRPVRRRDGTFNYSADNYCTKYDETTGICPDGDECPFLHRTAGDTERRYHLRYYKTCMCVHETDSRGYCVKNGHHCAFAHGIHDQRPPVYDIKELEAMQTAEGPIDLNCPNVLDKERSLMNEDPKWQDTNYVLSNYKTEPCKRPPRLCRQGYACPQFHNSKDKRRSPRKYKYRSTPCPNVKHGEEWGEPANCDSGDNCQYCHTRTEQQFHPEIYKSTKCNDVQQAGYCPRSVFCAFAHVEPYMSTEEMPHRDLDGPPTALGLSDIISNAFPMDMNRKQNDIMTLNGHAESSESASPSSLGSNHSTHNKAPGSQLHKNNMNHLNSNHSFLNNLQSNNLLNNTIPDFTPEITKQLMTIDNDPLLGPIEKENRKRMCLTFGLRSFGSIDSRLSSSGLLQNSSAPVNIPGSPITNSLSGILHSGTSAPVTIPGSQMTSFSPTNHHSNLFSLSDSFHGIGVGSAPKISNSFNANDSLIFQSHISPGLGDGFSMSPDLNRISELNSINNELSNMSTTSNNLFDNHPMQANKQHQFSMSPLASVSELGRLREELQNKNAQMLKYEDQIIQANNKCEIWKKQIDDCNRKAQLVEQQRDEALKSVQQLQDELNQVEISRTNELKKMPLQQLKSLHSDLRQRLEEVEKVLYAETASKCMECQERPRAVTLIPCNHYVLCDLCASTQRECPYCQMPVSSQN